MAAARAHRLRPVTNRPGRARTDLSIRLVADDGGGARGGGRDAVFLVVPVLGAAAVWLMFLLGSRVAGPTAGALAAVLFAASPIFLFQVVQPMSDVPATAWWLLASGWW